MDKMQLFTTYLSMTDEERAKVIDTGFFNSFIEAYMILAMKGSGRTEKEIADAKAELKNIFSEVSADEAKKIIKK